MREGFVRWATRIAAASFACAAAFHAVALARPDLGNPSPAWRHALFVAINATYAIAFWRAPRWLGLLYAPLAIQQAWSHGVDFAAAARVGRFDAQSALVLATIPAFVWLCVNARGRSRPR